ncbi:Rna polymerase II accessory factor CDC73 [Cardiosporidium cionae]|uniref:Rna polymerase II accessory factor CDC73 n=1 Tax=Cardiosporidium cionae TaxID=476202 RepID=A0ABQ7JFN1_9APIC|nr:Rna polymerase II accessory factor CDC73 [Cardiosporidium cionae]|eukprot:KAF8822460.1 Rna polymerase II accessory factor CDC73 [Cardiosporidium cionae]
MHHKPESQHRKSITKLLPKLSVRWLMERYLMGLISKTVENRYFSSAPFKVFAASYHETMATISAPAMTSLQMASIKIEEGPQEKEGVSGKLQSNSVPRRSYLINPFLFLKEIQKGYLVTNISPKSSDGEDVEVLVLKNCNIEIPSNTPSGLITRKSEPYTIGDIHLVLVTPKEEYNYSFVMSRKGRKYLNVLERTKVVNALLSGEGGKSSSAPSIVPPIDGSTSLGSSYSFERSLSLKETTSTTLPLDLTLQRHLAYQHDPKVPVCFPKESLWISKKPEERFGDADEDSDDDEMLFFLEAGAPAAAANEPPRRRESSGITVEGDKGSNAATAGISSSEIDGNTLLKTVLKREKSVFSRYNVVCSFGCDFERVLLKCEDVDRSLHNGHRGRKYCHLPPSIHQAQIAQKLRRNAQWVSEQERRARLKRSATTSFPAKKTAQIQACQDKWWSASSIMTLLCSAVFYCYVAVNLCVMDICIAQNTLPIILVPSGPTALISRNNAIDMLQNGKFMDPLKAPKLTTVAEDKKALHSFGAITIDHFFKGKNRKFQVIESRYASRFQAKEWNSVVAVLLHGGRWQFHGWPFSNFTDLFLSVMGCMFLYDTDTLLPDVNNWRVKVILRWCLHELVKFPYLLRMHSLEVFQAAYNFVFLTFLGSKKILRISRSHRYNDTAICKEFWEVLEQFLLSPRVRHPNVDLKLNAT